jgi:hypothetical protein
MILNEGSYVTSGMGIVIGSNRLLLLGVLFAAPQYQADGSITIVEIPTAAKMVVSTNLPVHLGFYVKAREITALKTHLFSLLGVSATL